MRNVAGSEVESPTGHHDVVDVRFPAPWIFEKRFKRLTGDALKLFLFGYGYSVFNEMEGRIPDDDLAEIPGVNLAAVQELAAVGLWTRDGDSWVLDRYDETQSSLAELAAASRARVLARDRKARQRSKEKSESDAHLKSRVTSEDRKGKDRTGVEVGNSSTARDPDEGWPPPAPVGAGFDPADDRKLGTDWPVTAVPGQRRDPEPPPQFVIFDRVNAKTNGQS